MSDAAFPSIDAAVDSGADPELTASNRQMILAVEAAMANMPPRCLEVIRLRKLDGLSHAEIGERLGLSTKTVKRYITNALRLCHQALIERRSPSAGNARSAGGSHE